MLLATGTETWARSNDNLCGCEALPGAICFAGAPQHAKLLTNKKTGATRCYDANAWQKSAAHMLILTLPLKHDRMI
jgi:hypothetical protein